MGKYITSLFEPTIELQELALTDYSYGTADERLPEASYKDIELRGVEYPHIQVNNYIFGPKEILKFHIDNTGLLPRVYIKTILLTSGRFLSNSFPTDGDIVSVFIRGRDDLFKPIRNDYLITSVESRVASSTSTQGKGTIIEIEGELYIPTIYDDGCEAFTGTSFNIMKKLAKRLGLGFATNENSTNDTMTWIRAKDNTLEFMKHLTGSAWKDKNSFFYFFIDVYYHLNFINVNDLISYDSNVLLALAEDTHSGAQVNFEKTEKGIEEKCFSNHPGRIRSNFFVKNFKPINNSSNISKRYGYAFNATFFEHTGLKSWQLQAKSLTTPGTENNKIILRGRPNDDTYNSLQKYNYIGIQHNLPEHNVHENFYYARIHNMMNLMELDKLNVEIILNKFNFNIYRFENIPAVFFVTDNTQRVKELNSDGTSSDTTSQDGLPIAIDKFYTGFYLIKGYIINYHPSWGQKPADSNFTESIVLTRREWPSPSGL